jgi:hypothetical protein
MGFQISDRWTVSTNSHPRTDQNIRIIELLSGFRIQEPTNASEEREWRWTKKKNPLPQRTNQIQSCFVVLTSDPCRSASRQPILTFLQIFKNRAKETIASPNSSREKNEMQERTTGNPQNSSRFALILLSPQRFDPGEAYSLRYNPNRGEISG